MVLQPPSVNKVIYIYRIVSQVNLETQRSSKPIVEENMEVIDLTNFSPVMRKKCTLFKHF